MRTALAIWALVVIVWYARYLYTIYKNRVGSKLWWRARNTSFQDPDRKMGNDNEVPLDDIRVPRQGCQRAVYRGVQSKGSKLEDVVEEPHGRLLGRS